MSLHQVMIHDSDSGFIEMDVDAKSSSTRSQKAGRVQKRNRKPRNSIVFKAKTYSKDKKGSKRK